MCEVSTLVALGIAAAGAGATAYGQSKANNATEDAVAAHAAQQRALQMRQQEMISQQDAAREDAKRVFQNTILPSIDKNTVAAKEAEQSERLKGIFNAETINAASRADPTQAAQSVSTVGAPTAGTAQAGKTAYDASLAKNLAAAIGFNTQQAGARANIDGRSAAAAEQQRQMGLGMEDIYQHNDRIGGIGRNIQNVGGLMDASSVAGQAAVGAAGHKGDSWKTVGTIANVISSLYGGGVWGSLAGAASGAYGANSAGRPANIVGGGNAATAQRYYSTSGQRIN